MNYSTEEIIVISVLFVAWLLIFIYGGLMGWFDSLAGPKYELERSMARFAIENRVTETEIQTKNGDWIKGVRVVDNRNKWCKKFTALEVDSLSEVRIVKKN